MKLVGYISIGLIISKLASTLKVFVDQTKYQSTNSFDSRNNFFNLHLWTVHFLAAVKIEIIHCIVIDRDHSHCIMQEPALKNVFATFCFQKYIYIVQLSEYNLSMKITFLCPLCLALCSLLYGN